MDCQLCLEEGVHSPMTIIDIGTPEVITGKAYYCEKHDLIEEIEPALLHHYE